MTPTVSLAAFLVACVALTSAYPPASIQGNDCASACEDADFVCLGSCKFHQCCEDAGLDADVPLLPCNYTRMLENMTPEGAPSLAKSIYPNQPNPLTDMLAYLKCFGKEADVTECCVQARMPEACLSMCNAKVISHPTVSTIFKCGSDPVALLKGSKEAIKCFAKV